jgi:predicted transposase YbfD/YdcC
VNGALATLPELVGVLVTADASHCQRAHADFLAARGGHYLFTVKGSQPLLRQALLRLPWAHAPGTRRRGAGHGRTESRSIKVIDLDGTDARALFPHARRAIKVVRRRRVADLRPSVEIVYAVTSLDHRAADLRLLATWLQGHWAIENSVHHVRDATQHEDASRIRLGARRAPADGSTRQHRDQRRPAGRPLQHRRRSTRRGLEPPPHHQRTPRGLILDNRAGRRPNPRL